MRQRWFLSLSLGGSLAALTLPAHAQGAGGIPIITPGAIPGSSGRSSARIAAANAATEPAFTYEDYRKGYNASRITSIATLRGSAAALNGSVVELKGAIIGSLSNAHGRTCMLQLSDGVAELSVPPELSSLPALGTGQTARVLARVGGDAALTVVVATNQPEPVPVEQLAPAPPTSPGTANSGDILVGPAMSAALPQAPASQNTRLAPAPTSGSAGDAMSQKPAYAALVRGYNRKLREDQVDAIATTMIRAGYENNIDPRFLAAIIAVESDFDIYCLSNSGAMGLGQLMPFNVKEAGITNPWDPAQNVTATARLLRHHLNDYVGRPNATLLAVAAYNAGPGAVRRAGYQVPNGDQVQRYVWKVYYRYKAFAPDMFK